MSMNIFALCGCAVVACVLIITVRQHRPDMAAVLSVAAGVVLFTYIAIDLKGIIGSIHDLTAGIEGFSDEISAVIKALGVCLIVQLAADICRDSGQSTVASRVELGGRAAVLILLMPLFARVLEAAAMLTGAAD